MLNIFMAEIGLERTRVVPIIGELVTAGVAQHVRVGLDLQTSSPGGGRNDAREAGRGKRTSALAREDKG